MTSPIIIRLHPQDNVAVVANEGGLPAGTALPGGPTLAERVPQAHKVALENLAEGAEVRRYGVVIGHTLQALPAGSWAHEQRLVVPEARALQGLPMATRNLLAITTTVQCVAGRVDHAVERIRRELLPKYPNVDGVLALEHSYGGGLVFAATPASDFICGTLQLAAGMNLHVFTTARGTPYGLAECPVVKVATRSELARRWHDRMDVNAGRVADGELTLEEAGFELFQLLLAVASGQRTWAERHRLHNARVLFNPAPIT